MYAIRVCYSIVYEYTQFTLDTDHTSFTFFTYFYKMSQGSFRQFANSL